MSRKLELSLLVLILLLSLGVRFYGLDFGLPYTIHPDEPNIVDHAVVTLKTGDWNPHWYIYPSGYHYLQTGVLSLHLFWGIARGMYTSPADLPDSSHVITAAPATYVWARATTALLGVFTVFLLYLLGRRSFGAATGLTAALLLALSPMHVEHSHYITTDVPTAALALLSLYLTLEVLERGGAGRVFLAGLIVGVAGSFKYNAVVALLPLLLALALRTFRLGTPEEGLFRPLGRLLNRELALALLGVVVGYVLLCPFTFADLPTFLDDLGYETHLYRFGGEEGIFRVYQVAGRLLPPWQAYAHTLWVENPLAALAGLGGTLLALFRRRREDILLLIFIWGYYFFLGAYGTVFVRNVLLVLPALLLLGSDLLVTGVAWLAQRPPWRRSLGQRWPLLLAGLLLLMLLSPTRRILKEDAHLAIPPTQRQARQWLDAHLSPGDKVAAELHPLLFSRVPYTVTPVDYMSNYPLKVFVNQGYRYVVVNSERYGPEFAEQDLFPDYYAALLDQLEPVADFAGHTQGQIGPRLTIFGLPQGELRLQHPLDLIAGPGLRLLGFDAGQRRGQGELSYVSPVNALQAGQVLGLTLYLQADAPLPEDYVVALRLRDAEGRVVAGQEQPPCTGACPTSAWLPGQVVVAQADLPLSAALPAGTYHLEMHFLRPGTDQPLPLSISTEKQGIIVLIELTIQERSP